MFKPSMNIISENYVLTTKITASGMGFEQKKQRNGIDQIFFPAISLILKERSIIDLFFSSSFV